MTEVRLEFEAEPDGLRAMAARTALVDSLLCALWNAELEREPGQGTGLALLALGGYGRAQLFPCSDVDVLFAVERSRMKTAQDAIRRVSQALWDCGLRTAAATRTLNDCERFEPGNAEFSLALLDARAVAGDPATAAQVRDKVLPRLIAREGKRIARELGELTRSRHARYGDTLFHLEPNLKDCPGGLRDHHTSAWLRRLRGEAFPGTVPGELREALAFLTAARCFLHYRHERDDNMLDWQAQDAAAGIRVGLDVGRDARLSRGAAYWMRVYFRHARTVERQLLLEAELSELKLGSAVAVLRGGTKAGASFMRRGDVLELAAASSSADPATEGRTVFALFEFVAHTGARLSAATEKRISDSLPRLSSTLEEGPASWQAFRAILLGPRAGVALRSMHALGLLELILPEFHGIDALVIRDAYHRYTVDEHTFVLIDVLHRLESDEVAENPEWRRKLSGILREVQHPDLLFLASLLHDTGKAKEGENHPQESARLAEKVLERFGMDSFGTSMVLQLIETHLEMSGALRRDIFDAETVRAFAGKVQTHESLRMLTLFTYADIAAVHPDALTPWKAENLWRLSMATANELDRRVDDERFVLQSAIAGTKLEGIARALTLSPARRMELERFLEGLPERYGRTRAPETILEHAQMAARCQDEPIQLAFRHGREVSEITLVTPDRPQLFSDLVSALTAWGMNVVTADAFSNAAGLVVDSFRFTDTFQTLAMNLEERARFTTSLGELLAERATLEAMLAGRRRSRRPPPRMVVETSIEFDNTASSHSTLLQVVAQDVPGLLRAISLSLNETHTNVEVALVDTEGETAIDVFYLTRAGAKLTRDKQKELRNALLCAIEENSRALEA